MILDETLNKKSVNLFESTATATLVRRSAAPCDLHHRYAPSMNSVSLSKTTTERSDDTSSKLYTLLSHQH